MKSYLNLLILSCFLFSNAFAAGLPFKPQADEVVVGKDGSTDDKKITINVGDGASNPKIEVDAVTKKFEINKGIDVTGASSITGNTTVTGDLSASGNASVGGNATITGDATITGGDITIGAGSTNKIRANAGKLEFTNDGTIYKKFGSGSGGDGGVNILENESFEDGLPSSFWQNSGGTFSAQDYTNPAGNELKYARFIATTSGQYFETSLKAIPDFGTGGCLGKINYNTADASNWKIQVYDSLTNLLKEDTLTAKSWQDAYAPFPCPTAGTTVKVRIISLGAGQIEADKGYLGKENRTFQISQAQAVGSAYHAPTGSCTWTTTSASYADFATVAACPTITVDFSSMGSWQVVDSNLPQVTINNLPAGRYVVEVMATLGASTTANMSLRVSDGTNHGPGAGTSNTGSGSYDRLTTKLDVEYATAGNRTFKVQGQTSAGTMSLFNAVEGYPVQFRVYYYPNSSQTALVPEAQDWFIDTNIGGSLINLGTSSYASYTELTSNGLDLVINTGSAAAKIPCTGTNAPQGLTCNVGPVNESVGLVFTNPTPGYFEVCAAFTHSMSIAATGGVTGTFQLIETPINAQTIVQEGKARTSSSSSAPNSQVSAPHKNCGTFYFSSVQERAIRLMAEMSISGTPSSNYVLADRAAAAGQYDIQMTVRPLLSPYNRPYSQDDATFRAKTVTSPGVTKPVLVSAKMAADGTISSEYVDFVSGNCTNSTTATCTFNPGFWTASPNCWVESNGGSNLTANMPAWASTTSMQVYKQDLGAVAFNHATTIFCHGPATNQ